MKRHLLGRKSRDRHSRLEDQPLLRPKVSQQGLGEGRESGKASRPRQPAVLGQHRRRRTCLPTVALLTACPRAVACPRGTGPYRLIHRSPAPMIPGISPPSRLGGLSVIYSKGPFVGVLLRTQELFMVGFGSLPATTASSYSRYKLRCQLNSPSVGAVPRASSNRGSEYSGSPVWLEAAGPKSTGTRLWTGAKEGDGGTSPTSVHFSSESLVSLSLLICQVDADVSVSHQEPGTRGALL